VKALLQAAAAAAILHLVALPCSAEAGEGLQVQARRWRQGKDAYFSVTVTGHIAAREKAATLSLPEDRGFFVYRKQLASDSVRFLGRFSGMWPRSFVVSAPGEEDISLSGISTPVADEALAKQWAALRIDYLRSLAERLGGSSFLAYQAAWLSARHGLPVPKMRGTRGAGRSAVDLIDIAGADLAFDASLESGALGRRAAHRGPESFKTPAAKLKAPDLPNVRYSAIADVKGVELPAPLDLVPRRCAAFRVKRISKALQLSDFLGRLSSLFAQASGWGSGRASFGDLVMQLGFQGGDALRSVYPLAVGDATVLCGDFYFPEGAEFGLILRVKNEKLFNNRIQASRLGLAKGLPNTRTSSLHHGGYDIQHLRSADERLRSFYTSIGDYAVFTNTLTLVKEIIDASADSSLGLASTTEARGLWVKAEGAEHDAFGCVPVECIRRLTAAPTKIAELRRITCGAEMELLTCARGFSVLTGAKADEPRALVGAGFLANTPTCPEGGVIAYSNAADRYRCSLHLLPGNLERVSMRQADNVSSDEERRYAEFVEAFVERPWGRGACSVAATIDIGPSLVIRLIVPRLPEDRRLNTFRGFFGGNPIELYPKRELAPGGAGGISFKLRPFHRYTHDLSHVWPESFREKLRSVRDRAQGHLGWPHDYHMLSWAEDRATYTLSDQDSFPGFTAADGLIRLSSKDRDMAVESLATLQRLGAFFKPPPLKGIRRIPIKDVVSGPVHSPAITTIEALETGIKYHTAFGSQAVYIGTDRDLLKRAVSAEAGGPGPLLSPQVKKLLGQLPRRCNMVGFLDAAAAPKLLRAALCHAETNAAKLCEARREFIDDLRQHWALSHSGRDEAFAMGDACRAVGLKSVPQCPDGGHYVLASDGRVRCSVHTGGPPREDGLPPADAPSSRLAEIITATALAIQFEERGKEEGVTVTLAIDNPDYRFRPFDWAVERFGWAAIVVTGILVLLALYVLLRMYKRLRGSPSDATDAPVAPAAEADDKKASEE